MINFTCPPLSLGRRAFCNYRVKRDEAGFTLIELIVVMVILSMLAAGIIPSITTQIRREKIKETKDEIMDLHNALIEYYKDLDTFPQSPGDLKALEEQNQVYPVSYRSRWDGPYIRSKFKSYDYEKDAWDNNYKYSYTPNNTYCNIYSYGPNKQDENGGGDDIFHTVEANVIRKQKIYKVKEELEVIKKAAQQYYEDFGSYPPNIRRLFNTGYLEDKSYQKDEWGNDYVIESNKFKSLGPDGANGTSDDIYPY
jgi:general secretion pathway protein G